MATKHLNFLKRIYRKIIILVLCVWHLFKFIDVLKCVRNVETVTVLGDEADFMSLFGNVDTNVVHGCPSFSMKVTAKVIHRTLREPNLVRDMGHTPIQLILALLVKRRHHSYVQDTFPGGGRYPQLYRSIIPHCWYK